MWKIHLLALLLSLECNWSRLSAYGRSDDELTDDDDNDDDDDGVLESTKANAATKLILGGSWRDGGDGGSCVEVGGAGVWRPRSQIVSSGPDDVKFK